MFKLKWKLFILFILLASGKIVLANISDTSVSVVPLPAPTGLVATVKSSEQIDLGWSQVSGADTYNIYKDGTLIASPVTNFYSITGLAAGTLYTFTVSAVNVYEESPQSSPISATTSQQTQESPTGGGQPNQGQDIYFNQPEKGGFRMPQGGFKILINSGDEKTKNSYVIISLFGGPDAVQVKISDDIDFKEAKIEKYEKTKKWTLSTKDGEKTVYAKFLNKASQESPIVKDSIVLDTKAPDIEITNLKNFYEPEEDIILQGTTTEPSEIIFSWDWQYGSINIQKGEKWIANLGQMKSGKHPLAITVKDSIGNSQTIKATVSVKGPKEDLSEGVAKISTTKFSFLPALLDKIIRNPKSLFQLNILQEKNPLKIATISAKTPKVLKSPWNLIVVKAQKKL